MEVTMHWYLVSFFLLCSLATTSAIAGDAYQIEIENFRFDLNLTDRRISELSVLDLNTPGKVIWQTSKRYPLLTIDKAKGKVRNNRASFKFSEKPLESCLDPVVESWEQKPAGLTMSGSFSDCPELGFDIHFEVVSKDSVAFSAELIDHAKIGYNRINWSYGSHEKEFFYGFGEQYAPSNPKGKKLPIWLEEQGHGRGLEPLSSGMKLIAAGASVGNWATSYSAVASYITNTGKGLCLDNTEYLVFDLERSDSVKIRVWSDHIKGRIFSGPTPLNALEQLTAYTGRMLPLPEWTQNGIIIRAGGGEQNILESLATAKKAGIPVAAVWIEDWVGHRSTLLGERLWWNWQANPHLYPDWPATIERIKATGTEVLIYFNPYLSDTKGSDIAFADSLFNQASAFSYFVQDSNQKPFEVKAGLFGGYIVDLTNPLARDFMKRIMIKQLELGVAGWMADFGEAIPYDAMLYSGETGASFHNQYALEWSKLTSEAIRETGKEGQAFSFHRSGNLKSPQFNSMFWTGDQLANWDDHDGIGTVIPALTSSGMSGWALSHSDIGGFLALDILFLKYHRTKELFLRWLELNTFTSLLRTHSSNNPKLSHQWDSDSETLAAVAKMTTLFSALKPYKEKLFEQAYTRGLPVVRHMSLHYPNDRNTWHLYQQFMFGSEFLVAPVVAKAKLEVDVYLPKGEWIHLWSGKTFSSKGAYVRIAAPIGEPAVFFKKHSFHGRQLRENLMNVGLIEPM
jgi:alpha-glucosidase